MKRTDVRRLNPRYVVSGLALAAMAMVLLNGSRVMLLALLLLLLLSAALLSFGDAEHATTAQGSEGRAAAALARNEQMLAAIESVTEGVVQIGESGRVIHANSAARELLHWPVQVEGQSAASLLRNRDLRSCVERALAGVWSDPAEINLDDRQLLVSARPIRKGTSATAVYGAVLSIVDLSETRRVESVRRDFVANVSHELKTPLTSIRGYAETLLNDDVAAPMQRQFLEVIHRNAARVQRIIDDLLDLSRLQSGGWQPVLQRVDAAALAEDVWRGRELGHDKNIVFTVSTRTNAHVHADPGGLRQVLSNLFDNSIRHTPAGGSLTVVIDDERDSPESKYISVIDTGSGIPSDALPRVFERFYRVDPARSREAGGTGLGLAIVKHLVERMDGNVEVESELGKGTTIRLRLPAFREI